MSASLDPRKVLAAPAAVRFLRRVVGGAEESLVYARDYVRARAGERVLDVGCGTGDLLGVLPDVDYVGFDEDARYVAAARRRYGKRGTFLHRRVDNASLDELGLGSFDVVSAHGLVHHLNDAEAQEFFRLARAALKPGGRLVTADGCYATDQSAIVRYLLRNDRGPHMRTAPAYEALAKAVFARVESDLRHDLFRLPYTLILMECGPASDSAKNHEPSMATGVRLGAR